LVLRGTRAWESKPRPTIQKRDQEDQQKRREHSKQAASASNQTTGLLAHSSFRPAKRVLRCTPGLADLTLALIDPVSNLPTGLPDLRIDGVYPILISGRNPFTSVFAGPRSQEQARRSTDPNPDD
jgi:hypothetical protein